MTRSTEDIVSDLEIGIVVESRRHRAGPRLAPSRPESTVTSNNDRVAAHFKRACRLRPGARREPVHRAPSAAAASPIAGIEKARRARRGHVLLGHHERTNTTSPYAMPGRYDFGEVSGRPSLGATPSATLGRHRRHRRQERTSSRPPWPSTWPARSDIPVSGIRTPHRRLDLLVTASRSFGPRRPAGCRATPWPSSRSPCRWSLEANVPSNFNLL